MADDQKSPRRTVQRCCELSHLEELLWMTAYEQIWPFRRRRLSQSAAKRRECQRAHTIDRQARRACGHG